MSRHLTTTFRFLIAVTVFSIAALSGCGGSGGGPDLSGITSNLRFGGTGGDRAMDAVQVGAKAMDVLDLESPARQDEIGQSVAVAISNRFPVSTDESLNDYINLVGLTVASASPRPDLNFAFGVLETPQVGAYSTPGGYVFITRGALGLMEDESELAGVLAHEVAHVVLNHGIDAVKAAKRTDLALSAAKTADQQIQAYGRAVDVAADAVLVKGYNRNQESQSDTHAVKYLIAAGYDPNGLVRFLGRMQQQQGPGGGARQLMSTHPGTAERITRLRQQIAKSQPGGATLKERFSATVR